MGATDSTAICNIALRKIGDNKITSISDTDDSAAVKCNDVYASLLKALLMDVKPRFAVKSAKLGHVTDSTTNITDVSVSSGVVTVTAVNHGLTTGDIASIVSVAGMVELNGIKYTITKLTDNTLTLDGIDGTNYTDYTSGGTIGEVSAVPSENDYDNRYNLPSDLLVLWKVNDKTTDYSIEWGGSADELFTDDVSVDAKYIYSVTTTTLFDDLFVDLLAWALASDLVYTISQSHTLAKSITEKYEDKLAKYKSIMSQSQGSPRQARQDEIITARS